MLPTTVSESVRELTARRWRIAILLTTVMVVVYFGFILLVAFEPDLLGTMVGNGLSLGIVLGVLVIIAAWLLTWTYVSWANRIYDPALDALRRKNNSRSAAGTGQV